MERGAQFPVLLCIGEPHENGLILLDGLRVYLAALNVAKVHFPMYIVPWSAAERLAW